MNQQFKGNLPWPLSFSYGRALQAAGTESLAGRGANVAAAQAALAHRAKMNGLASLGRYATALERQG